MRVYLPATLPMLARWLQDGSVGPAPLLGCAVTPALREWFAEGDEEELEYAASTRAARLSLQLLAADADAPPRRVVVAVDVPEKGWRAAADEDADPSVRPALVTVSDEVGLPAVACALVDDTDAQPAVSAAARAWTHARTGDVDAAFAVDAADDHELGWFAAGELPGLVEDGA